MVLVALVNKKVERVASSKENSGFLSLELALDWLCLNLPSKDLPKLFTEVNLDEEKEMKLEVLKLKSIEVLKVPYIETVPFLGANGTELVSNIRNGEVKKAGVEAQRTAYEESEEHINMKKDEKERKKADDATKRAWLLQQYQYEDYEDDFENEKDVLKEPKNDQNIIDAEKSPEEIRLQKIEEQIREDEAALNDEAANYMRSKYETMDIKKRIKKLTNQAKGLRAKLVKRQAKTEREVLEDEGSCSQEADNSTLFDLFESNTSSGNIIPVSNIDDANVTEPDHNMQNATSVADLSIPKDWTGKTPKVFLSEYCQKRKLPKPTYKRVPSTHNGCKVTICFSSQASPLVFDQNGPFRTYTDAQHFVSTVALFDLNPVLPLYRLFPPAFRELWKTWLNDKKTEQSEDAKAKEDTKMEKIISMINSIPTVKRDIIGKTNTLLQDGKVEESETIRDLGDWDNDSFSSSEDSNHPSTITRHLPSQPKQPSQLGMKLKDNFKNKVTLDTSKQKMRSLLPIFDYKEKILDTMREHPVTVLCAETGKCAKYPRMFISILKIIGITFHIFCK